MKFSALSRKWRRYMIVTCVAAVAAIATDWRRLLKDFNDFCYHARHLVAGKRDEAQHLTIVAVDGDTCDRLKEDPLAPL